MSLQTEAYRAALVLNNRGVDQINLRCLHEAMKAFQGALSLLKLSIMYARESHEISTNSMSSKITVSNSKQVSSRGNIIDLLNSTVSKNDPFRVEPSFQHTYDYMKVNIITDDKMLSPELVDTALSSPSSSDICFIRIDDMSGQCDVDDGNFGMDKSIVFYNIGSLYFMNAMSLRDKGKHKKSNEYFSRSLKAYQWSLQVISYLKESPQIKSETWLDLLCIIILQRLSYVTLAIGSATLARMYYSLLGEHRSILISDPSILYVQSKESQSIGAAAA